MKSFLKQLSQGAHLNEVETHRVFEMFMEEGATAPTDAQIGAYLFSTSTRGATADELVGAAHAMIERMVDLQADTVFPDIDLLDTCGTGGSGYNTFNTSTAVSLLVAACGQPVAKHGNRAAVSKSGSADVLEALGVNIHLTVLQKQESILKTNFCFLFAPDHHLATKRVSTLRKELGVRTIFNYLGPLVNPARTKYQLLGVSNRNLVGVFAEVLKRLGSTRAMVVCGHDGLDEITLTERTDICELRNGAIRSFSIAPEDFSLTRVSLKEIEGREPKEAAELIHQIFQPKHRSPYRDLVVLNAGAALYVCDRAATIAEGMTIASETLDSGKAEETLAKIIQISKA